MLTTSMFRQLRFIVWKKSKLSKIINTSAPLFHVFQFNVPVYICCQKKEGGANFVYYMYFTMENWTVSCVLDLRD